MLEIRHNCGYVKEFEFLCPKCHLPLSEGSNECSFFAGLLGHIKNYDKIVKNQENIEKINCHFRRTNKVSADYNVSLDDDVIFADTTNVIVNLILPSSIGNIGKCYTLIRTNAGTKNLIIKAQNGEKINDNNSETIVQQFGSRTIISNGERWIITSKTP
jgi:hypothetical protein